MSESYETRHVESEQPSSAGLPTQHLPPLAATGAATPIPRRTNNNAVGLVLVGAGLLMWLTRGGGDSDGLRASMILLTIASPFFFVAFWRRIYGFLIPACILTGLSLAIPLADFTSGVSVLWGLGLGFLGIFVLGRVLFNVHSRWPLYPAIPLFMIGVITAIATLPTYLGVGMLWFPLLLVGAGLYLGSKRG